jgi:NAD(P)-dependent dehydrogenase (short-subunit alcohol dehydrogenase family)
MAINVGIGMARSNWDTDSIGDQSGRVVVVTGATSGIGEQTARVLAGKNAKVILAVRNPAKGEVTIASIRQEFPRADVQVLELDLSCLRSINAFCQNFSDSYDRLDILINNAGIMWCPYEKTVDGFEIQLGTNHLGHFALTLQLMPLLLKTGDSRVVNVSSIAHKAGKIDFDDMAWESRSYKTVQAYSDSKIANLYFTHELARKLEGIEGAPRVTAAHPGWTRSELQRHSGLMRFLNSFFAQYPDMGALPTLRAAIDPDAQPGDYFGPSKFFEMHGYPAKVKADKRSQDRNAAERLWSSSERLTAVHFPQDTP